MSKVKVEWYSRPSNTFKKDVVLERFKWHLRGLGLHDETVKLHIGRAGAFLNYAKEDLPSLEAANDYRAKLIDSKLSRGHINNSCFAIKKFYGMNNIEWNFIVLKTIEGVPFYFDENDVLAILGDLYDIIERFRKMS